MLSDFRYSDISLTRQWKWLGHVLRMPSDKNSKIALMWAPEGKRRQGWPRETWQRTVNKERKHLGFKTWRQAEVAARDKVTWKRRINGPFSMWREMIDDDDDDDHDISLDAFLLTAITTSGYNSE